MADLRPGATFAGHRIEGVAGRGGMGTVYRATHLALDHVVALKVISTELAADDAFRERFRSESRIAVSLRHPNVVPIHHAGEEDGLLFVTMDLIDGPDLRRLLISDGTLEPERAAALIGQVASALDVAHSRGLVHRDIKPGNVLIEQRPGEAHSEHAYLTDFGLAKRFDQATDVSGLTGTGAFVGTLDYVAPEQIRGERVDARTDVYALGCVLYEVLAGRPPFGEREEKVAKIYAHLQDEPPWLPGQDEAALDEVVGRALAKSPGDRFPSAGDLARAASAAASGIESRQVERSVATGRAAPLTPVETQETPPSPPPPTEETPPPPPATTQELPPSALPPAEHSDTDPERTKPLLPPHPPARAGGPSRRVLLGALVALVAVALAGALLLGGGDEEPPSDEVAETTTDGGGAGDGGGNGAGGGAGGGGGSEADDVVSEPFVDEPAIPVDGFPVGLNIHEGQVSVTSRGGASLATIDKTSREPVGPQVDLPGEGEDVATENGFAWVTMPKLDQVAKVSLDDGSVSTIAVGDDPRGIVASRGFLWVANLGSGEISKIDAATDAVRSITLADGGAPTDIAFEAKTLWVTDRSGDRVIRIDGASQRGFAVGDNPKGVVVADGDVWVANTDSGTVSRLAVTGQTKETITVDGAPRGIAAGFGRIWVANGDGYVSAIDPNDTSAVVEVPIEDGASPEEVAIGPKRVWVTTGVGNSLVSIEPGGLP